MSTGMLDRMTRLTRAESQAQTRTQLVATAKELFLEDGYLAASLEKVADAAGFSKGFSPTVLMVAFSVLMLVVGMMLMRQKTASIHTSQSEDLTLWKVIAGGATVGLLTGILGVGGGFLIVPALVMLVGMPMHHAIGTSLVVIAMNSFAGFMGHLEGMTLDIPLITVFVTAGILGTFAGARLGKRLDALLLRKAFAIFVVGLAVLLLYDNLPKIL